MRESAFLELAEDIGYASAVLNSTDCDKGCFFWGIDFGYLYPGTDNGYACCKHFEDGFKIGESISRTERLKS